jgi:hypothetical protein
VATVLTIVVVAYNLQRELHRTLATLERGYQRDIDDLAFEVIVVDNGSPTPVDAKAVASHGPEFRVHRIDNASPSPVDAANLGVRLAKGTFVGVVLDAARMVIPGVFSWALRAHATHPHAVVTPPAWHGGPAHQSVSVRQGYTIEAQDTLLDGLGWQANGYELFDASALAMANPTGFISTITEGCFLVVRKKDLLALGGLDPAFNIPGGGFAALDIFKRLAEAPGHQAIILLGEGSFHQLHSRDAHTAQDPFASWVANYRAVRGGDYEMPRINPWFFGHMPPQAQRFAYLPPAPTPGPSFDERARKTAGRIAQRIKRTLAN